MIQTSRKTLYEYLIEANEKKPEQMLFVEKDVPYRVSEVYTMVNTYGNQLAKQGLSSGDILSLRMRRTVDAVSYLLAGLALGLVVHVVDEHVNYQVYSKNPAGIKAKAYLSDESGSWGMKLEDGETGWIAIGESGECDGSQGALAFSRDAMAPALIIETSGSTGQTKAVVHSQYSIINNLTDAYFFGDYREEDMALGILPFSHIFGLVLLFGALVIGYGIAFPVSYDLDDILCCMQKHSVSRVNSVPNLYLALAGKAGEYDLSALRVGFIGGAPYTQEEFHRIEAGLHMRLIPCYGMSECPSISIHKAEDPQEVRSRGSGQAYHLSKVCIKDDAEQVLLSGEEGEICVKSETLMLGYYRTDGGMELPLDADGFFHTGDLGRVEENGKVYITGRKKEIIIRNGNNISLRKIEEALLALPEVETAAAIGKADAVCGEVPVAFVCVTNMLQKELERAEHPARNGGRGLEEKILEVQILEEIAKRLVKNEMPVEVRVISEMPLTSSGKIDKQELLRKL